MTTLKILDGDGTTKYLSGTGTGTELDPFIPIQNISSTEFKLEVAKGNITGISQISKFGRLINIDTGDTFPKDVWNGDAVYSGFPDTAETLEVLSSSAADTAAGTGARTVTVRNLLDANGNAMPDITVTLNGTTPVSLGAQTYSRCSRMCVTTVGSGGGNAGTLTLRHSTTTTNIFAVMPIGFNSTHIMAYTVPVGKTLYVSRGNISLARASGAAGSANVTLRVRQNGTDTPFTAERAIDITESAPYKFENNGYMVFPARTDFKVQIESVSDNDTIISSEYDGYLVDD